MRLRSGKAAPVAIVLLLVAAIGVKPGFVPSTAATEVSSGDRAAASATQKLAGKDLVNYAWARGGRPIGAPQSVIDQCASDIAATGGLIHHAACELNATAPPPAPAPAPEPTPTPAPGPETPGNTPAPPAPAPPAVDPGFAYYPPGDLLPEDKKRGRVGDRFIYMPNIIFPLKLADGQFPHMNSQIRGHGGYLGPGGGQCDKANYDEKLQRDTFCELRDGRKTELCPTGEGHQGQDIRPPKCEDKKWDVVAVADGTISQFTSNTTVALRAADGTEYIYLHMHPSTIKVKLGSKVKQGDILGRVSNIMSGKVSTTIHLHFEARQNIQVGSKVISTKVPMFASLINALRKAKGLGNSADAEGNLVVDPVIEIGAPQPPPPPPAPPEPPTPPTPPAPEPPAPVPPAPPPAPEPAPPSPPEPPAPPPPPAPPEPPAPPPAPPTPPAPEPPAPPQPPEPPPAPPEPPAPPPAPPQPTPPEPPAPPPQPPAPPPEAPAPPAEKQGWVGSTWKYVQDWWSGFWKK